MSADQTPDALAFVMELLSEPDTPMMVCPHCTQTITLGELLDYQSSDDPERRAKHELLLTQVLTYGVSLADQDDAS